MMHRYLDREFDCSRLAHSIFTGVKLLHYNELWSWWLFEIRNLMSSLRKMSNYWLEMVHWQDFNQNLLWSAWRITVWPPFLLFSDKGRQWQYLFSGISSFPYNSAEAHLLSFDSLKQIDSNIIIACLLISLQRVIFGVSLYVVFFLFFFLFLLQYT